MLKQYHRFHGHGSLRFVYQRGLAARSSMMTIKSIANPHRKQSRFAVVISKKVIKSAVRRNRLRRRIFEIIRSEIPTIKSSHDIVVMVFSAEVFAMNHQELREMIKQLFSKNTLYK